MQHKGLNQYYDIPSISLRNPFLGQALSNTTFVEQMFGGKVEKAGTLEGLDLRHVRITPYNSLLLGQAVLLTARSRSTATQRWQSWSLPTSTRSTAVCALPSRQMLPC